MSQREPTIAKDWFRESFDAFYPVIYAHRTIEAAREEAEFSIQQAAIQPHHCVLDLACGNGRHMAHLLKAAGTVVGLDYSPHLLEQARHTLDPCICLVRGDMRAMPFRQAFDVILNYFTSFGYFATAEENLAVVRGINAALKPDGLFFMDYLNRNWAYKHIEPQSIRREGEFEIHEERWIDEEYRINKTTSIFKDGVEIAEQGESVRLYTLDEITDLLAKGGLDVVRTYGDYTGTDCCDPSKPRMIIIARKM